MDTAAEKPSVVLRPSGPTAFDPRTRQAAHELLAELASDDLNVTLQLPDPGQFSLQNSLEAIGIFIAGAASKKVLDLTLASALASTTRWLRNRFAKDKNAGAMYITIYGPDGKPLKNVLGRSADHIKDVTPPDRRGDSTNQHPESGDGIR
ncbi:hypothetical protein [Mycobacterium sp. UM_CSW]|uniref:hypothetical protein n=1 Tax=Mycobacterium sp. UM_CSW TaxID=1370119 RepID=UPI0012679F78|nr:hypothetical protein [Mycobacterium sp. UM_CSW]